MLHRNCKTDIKEFLHVIVAQLLAPDLKEKVKKCVNIMLRSPEKHFSQKLVMHSSLENLNYYTKIGNQTWVFGRELMSVSLKGKIGTGLCGHLFCRMEYR